MPDFAYDRTGSYGSLTEFYPKLDHYEMGTANTLSHLSSSEWNAEVEAVLAESYAVTSGSLLGFVRSATAPTSSVGDFLWLDSSGRVMIHRRDGTNSYLSGNVQTPQAGGYYQCMQNAATDLARRSYLFFDEPFVVTDTAPTTTVTLSSSVVVTSSAQTLLLKTLAVPVFTGTVSGDFHFSSSIRIRRDDVGAFGSGTHGLLLENTLPATSGSNPLSPALIFSSNALHSTASVSQNVKISLHAEPQQRNTSPDVALVFSSNVNDQGYNEKLRISSTAITASVPIVSTLTTELVKPNWIVMTLQNSYVHVSGAGYPQYASSSYYKDPNGIVHTRLSVINGTNAAVITNIPAGYRPGGQMIVPVWVDPSSQYNSIFVFIKKNGDINALVNGNASVHFWKSWPAEG